MSREKLDEELEQAVASAFVRGVALDDIKASLSEMQDRADALAEAFAG